MNFESLKDRCEQFQRVSDYRLVPNSYVMCIVDGNCFSKLIKDKFKKPFDKEFERMMNVSAKTVLESVSCAKFAYVHSDEISILISDLDNEDTDAYCGYRLCKLQSTISSIVTSAFNKEMAKYELSEYFSSPIHSDMHDIDNMTDEVIDSMPVYSFDCKCWNIPTFDDVISWIHFRCTDCIRNSKNQFAQTYASYDELLRKSADEQMAYVKENYGHDYATETDADEKYGRLFYPREVIMQNIEYGVQYKRSVIDYDPCPDMTDPDGRNTLIDILIAKSTRPVKVR